MTDEPSDGSCKHPNTRKNSLFIPCFLGRVPGSTPSLRTLGELAGDHLVTVCIPSILSGDEVAVNSTIGGVSRNQSPSAGNPFSILRLTQPLWLGGVGGGELGGVGVCQIILLSFLDHFFPFFAGTKRECKVCTHTLY